MDEKQTKMNFHKNSDSEINVSGRPKCTKSQLLNWQGIYEAANGVQDPLISDALLAHDLLAECEELLKAKKALDEAIEYFDLRYQNLFGLDLPNLNPYLKARQVDETESTNSTLLEAAEVVYKIAMRDSPFFVKELETLEDAIKREKAKSKLT